MINKNLKNTALGAALCLCATPLLAQDLNGSNLTLTGSITQNGVGTNFFKASNNVFDGRACIGNSCDGTEPFEQGPLRLKWSEPDILFEDSSTTGGISSNDWRLVINDSVTTKFAVQDIDGGTIPFTIEGGVPTNTLVLDSTGRIGVGTNGPQNDLHIASVNPAIRLDDVSEDRVWEINSDPDGDVFDIRDVTAGLSPIKVTGGTGEVKISGPFAVGSSRYIKHAFATVKPRDVLERLLKLEVSQWSYNSEASSVRHMGPVAEDFGALFALGPDDKHVSPADMSGVAFAAIQGLHQIIRERDAGFASLRQSHGKLNEQVESRDAEIDTLRKSQAKLKEQVSSRDAEISELRQSRDDFAARIEALEKLVSSGVYVTSATDH